MGRDLSMLSVLSCRSVSSSSLIILALHSRSTFGFWVAICLLEIYRISELAKLADSLFANGNFFNLYLQFHVLRL